MRARVNGGCLLLLWGLVVVPVFAGAAALERPDAITPDGGRYFGALVDGKLYGKGRVEWDNGARYEGSFENGLFSGKGRFDSGNGEIYEGDFVAGAKSGSGRMTLRNGAVYTGAFRGDYFNGPGRYETADHDVYEGTFENGEYSGRGRLIHQEYTYDGEFRAGLFWGEGELIYRDGRKYRGAFERGHFQGKGRYENSRGDVYEGDFDRDELKGSATYTRSDGSRVDSQFVGWTPEGPGSYTDARGNVYKGTFVKGALAGKGEITGSDGTRYEGELESWLPHGHGVLHLANGDVYEGGFEYGSYAGQGTLTYAKPKADGRARDSGIWRYGRLDNPGRKEDLARARANVERALYSQPELLAQAIAALAPRDPERINLYLLAIAGDGTQEVFHREVDFVREQFERTFHVSGHALSLVNSRNTVDTSPMASTTSIRQALAGIAARMDRQQDILFLFITSHGSKEHEISLQLDGMPLPPLSARELGALVKESGIRWKAVLISACYAGGFIEPLRDDRTLVIAAARHDRQSFGCADENEFTDFGRAYFKEALPGSGSFQDAFRKAAALVDEWETRERKGGKDDDEQHSLPQMESPPLIEDYLRRWWEQATARKPG